MSTTDPNDPLRWRNPDELPPPKNEDTGSNGEPVDPTPPDAEAQAEFILLRPEPPPEPIEPVEVISVIQAICWWCGDPAQLDHRNLCGACQVRVAERDRRRETERERRRDREEYDYEYESRYEERETAEEVESSWYVRESRSSRHRDRDDELNWLGPLQSIMVIYVILMLLSIGLGVSLMTRAGDLTEDDLLHSTAVVEILDTVIILVSLGMVSRKSLPGLSPGTRPVAWVVGMPVLVLLIVLNLLYMGYLREKLGGGEAASGMTLTLFTFILVCIQPAIVEELYFRYIAFGAMYRAAGLHATVWITGMMFAVMHIYQPLGVPYLFLAGVVFGYARVWGGIGLPIVMHFIHNFAVLAIESAR